MSWTQDDNRDNGDSSSGFMPHVPLSLLSLLSLRKDVSHVSICNSRGDRAKHGECF